MGQDIAYVDRTFSVKPIINNVLMKVTCLK